MEAGKTVQGATRLAFDAVEGVTNIVEGMYRNISSFSMPFGPEPEGGARGIAGVVHEVVRQSNGQIRDAVDRALGLMAPLIDKVDEQVPPHPNRQAAIAALNGVCGDHLEQTGNALALPMIFRRQGVQLGMDAESLREAYPDASGRILIALHGLCMNDLWWTYRGHNHAEMLGQDGGYSVVYLRYNSGRHISTNGQELAVKLQALLDAWPVPVKSITLLGYSMGGLLSRSALHYAQQQGLEWPRWVDKAVYLGTPHHGSAIERGGNWFHATFRVSPYTAPISALGRIRSAGITDLRYSNLLDEDWGEVEQFDTLGDLASKRARDNRTPVPLPEGIVHHAIAATLSPQPGAIIGKLLGDGVVHPSSGTGRHREPERCLEFDADKVRIFYDTGHLSLLDHPQVSVTLREWLL